MLKKKFKGRIHKVKKTDYNILAFYSSANPKFVKKMPKEKKNIWSLLFFLINLGVIAVVLAVQLNSEHGITSLPTLFKANFKVQYVFCALLCFIVANLVSAIKLNIYYVKLEKKNKLGLCFKNQMMCKYYTKITPFGLGGQPFQVYYFNKYGVKTTNSLTMVSCSYVSNKLMYGLIALIMIATFRFNKLLVHQAHITDVVLVMAIISFAILAMFLTFVILLCVNKPLGNKIVVTIVKILSKLKIVKNPSALYLKIMRPTLLFQRKMKKFFASKSITLSFLILSMLEYVIEYSIPFFIYGAFNGFDINMYWQLLSVSVIIELACKLVPLPGGSGMAELSFYAVFASLFEAGVLFWALILWRLISYYNYLFVGMGIMVYDYVYGNKKLKKRRLKLN